MSKQTIPYSQHNLNDDYEEENRHSLPLPNPSHIAAETIADRLPTLSSLFLCVISSPTGHRPFVCSFTQSISSSSPSPFSPVLCLEARDHTDHE